MRLATLRSATTTTAAVSDDAAGDTWRAIDAPDLSVLFARPDRQALIEAGAASGQVVEPIAFETPLPSPAKVICCGLNYGDHIAEVGREKPDFPTLFVKFADSLRADGADIVVRDSTMVDWEAELAVVVGATLTRAGRDEAAAAIAGWTVANDISMRDWQKRTLQWFQGKAWDGCTPVGPWVVTPDAFDPAAGVRVRCEINGEEVQNGDPGTLIFDAADLLSYVSTFTTLRAGDLVLTGTPGGVGLGMEPQRFLSDGDEVVTEVTGLGRLVNRIRFA
ncbi:fumarylacetoacetate hydrolase family protein [Mariniluteicoccus flavus]